MTMASEARKADKHPPAIKDLTGYMQTFIVKSTGSIGLDDTVASRDVFFRCGNWCYTGQMNLSFQHAFEMTLKDIPQIIPKLQQQQGNLTYLCNSSEIPKSSCFSSPLRAFERARDMVISELSSDETLHKIASLSTKHDWIENDRVYFELVGQTSHLFEDVKFICSKVYAYTKGLIFNTIYFDGTIYVTLQDLEGQQPLIDINFPDVSLEGEGEVISLLDEKNSPWVKLSICQVKPAVFANLQNDKDAVKDLSSDSYVQCYCILKSKDGSDNRDVMFRFGSWCYSGIVELAPALAKEDLPFLVPALRLQQNKLKFVSDVSCLPAGPHSVALEYAESVHWVMEKEAASSDMFLENLISRMSISNAAEESEAQQHWLNDDKSLVFFEFNCANTPSLDKVEMIVRKAYRVGGVVTVSIYYNGSFYLMINEADGHPLLDSKFPDISVRGQGHLIQLYPFGLSSWPNVRCMSIWKIGEEEGSSQQSMIDGDDNDNSTSDESQDDEVHKSSSSKDGNDLTEVELDSLLTQDHGSMNIEQGETSEDELEDLQFTSSCEGSDEHDSLNGEDDNLAAFPGIEGLRKCSVASSDEDELHLPEMSRVIGSALDVIDDVMLDISNAYDVACHTLNHSDDSSTNEKSQLVSTRSEPSRAKKLSILQKKLDAINKKMLENGETEQKPAWDESNGRPIKER